VVAQNVLPVLDTFPTILPVELTSLGLGNSWLKGHPRSRLTVSMKARDC